MQKITPKYLMWKVIISFLTQLMAAAAGVPFVIIAKANRLDGRLVTLILSIGTFLIFLSLQYQLMRRSNLSSISKKNYIIGEGVAYGTLCLIGHIVLAIFSKGLIPADFSYVTLVFFCGFPLTYLTNNILLGLPLQIALFFLTMLLLYALKKHRDPTLRGNRMPLPKNAVKIVSEEEAGALEDDEEGAKEHADITDKEDIK